LTLSTSYTWNKANADTLTKHTTQYFETLGCGQVGWAGAMKYVLPFAAVAEVATGIALLVVPSLVAWLLLGEALTGAAIVMARVAGIALVGLAISCWPGPPLVGMLTYNVAATLFLAYIGITGSAGPLLWPVVALHAILSVLMGHAYTADNRLENRL
jgi:hypothetical protein